jgi:hypothetical protein
VASRSINNTTQAWDFLKPRLRGSWFRIEANFPAGLGDAFGFYNRHTHWVEIKVDKDQPRPAQIIMEDEARKHSVPIWQAHISRSGVLQWRQHNVQCLPPPFFIS